MSRSLLVLGWHNIDPTPAFPATKPGPRQAGLRGFKRQLQWLGRCANVVPLAEALRRLTVGEPLPARAVALTFDDGYQDNVDLALPVLARMGMPATFFLVPGLLSRQVRCWWEDLAYTFDTATVEDFVWNDERFVVRSAPESRAVHDRLLPALKSMNGQSRRDVIVELGHRLRSAEPPPTEKMFMDWAGAEKLLVAGHEVGAHTVTHPILSRETEADQRHEVLGSRQMLRDRLGVPVDLLAYPNGTRLDYNAVTLHQVGEAGFAAAITTQPGVVRPGFRPFEVRRVLLTPESDLVSLCRSAWRLAARTVRARGRRVVS